jgi:protein-arginine kinase activator protein McsA
VKKAVDLSKLRKELGRAVEAEDYERAAKLRDQIRQAEG